MRPRFGANAFPKGRDCFYGARVHECVLEGHAPPRTGTAWRVLSAIDTSTTSALGGSPLVSVDNGRKPVSGGLSETSSEGTTRDDETKVSRK